METENKDMLNAQDEELEEDDGVIYLTDEEGNESPFEFLEVIGFEEKQYAVLLPLSETEEDETELLILEMRVDEDGAENFFSVTDERALTEVYELFKDMYEDDFNFVD
ncbi:MAG: DUF1292 domain-containing protein [Ruminococcus sp.]|nr:DUF1292 domain-containing protein [Ruminococcus sp.]